MKIALIQLEKL